MEIGVIQAPLIYKAINPNFKVDEVMSDEEVILKGLGPQLARVRNIAGATVLASGRVVLVLNVSDLLKSAVAVSGKIEPVAPAPSARGRKRKSVLVVEDSITARTLLKNGCKLVSEGANMPSAPEAIDAYLQAGVLYGPGKAANAGGVATSGLEMTQNSMRLSWNREEVDQRLHRIMVDIHRNCRETSEDYGAPGNYVMGANIAGFVKVADAMLDQGLL